MNLPEARFIVENCLGLSLEFTTLKVPLPIP